MAAATSKGPPTGTKGRWSADLTTRGGVRLHVRPALAADVDLLADLFRHVSAEDRRFRFMGAVKTLSRPQLATLVDADQGLTTFIAFNDESTPIACCTLAADPEGQTADVTLSVRSEWKGKGVSWTLLEHVLACAAARGLRRVESLESGDDREAINLQREMGFVARLHCADPVEIEMSKIIQPT